MRKNHFKFSLRISIFAESSACHCHILTLCDVCRIIFAGCPMMVISVSQNVQKQAWIFILLGLLNMTDAYFLRQNTSKLLYNFAIYFKNRYTIAMQSNISPSTRQFLINIVILVSAGLALWLVYLLRDIVGLFLISCFFGLLL